MKSISLSLAALTVMAGLVAAQPASAHPHVFVDAKAEVVFNAEGQIAAVRNIWQFDEQFSSFATVNLDADNDGTLSEEELEPLAKLNVDSLAEFGFFTYLTIADQELPFVPPTEYFLTYDNARLTLYYTLPLKEPATLAGPATLEVFDPEYFVAFTFVGDEPALLDGAPDGCTATFHPPQELDDQTMAILGAIPMDQRTIPDDLVAAAAVLANVIVVDCKDAAMPVSAPAAPAPEAPRPKPPSPFGIGTSDAPGGGWLRGPFGPFFLWIGQRQQEFYKALTGTFADIKADGRAAILLIGISFLYGVFHAAGPGHGKAVITSYLFSTGESVRRGIAISFASAFVQAFTAIAVVTVAVLILRFTAQSVTVATQWIEIGSYALIVLVGLWLVWSKTFGGGHHHHHHHHTGPESDAHAHGDEGHARHHRDEHKHDGDHHHDHDHDHGQVAVRRRVQWEAPAHDRESASVAVRQMAPRSSLGAIVAAVFAVGIRPCSGAIIVLVFAVSQGMFMVGVTSTMVMALGTGITVAALATLAVSAHGLALRLAGANATVAYRLVRGAEIVAAFLVLGLGIVLLGGAIAGGLPA